MRLSSFISANLDPILKDWVAFAGSQLPAAADLDEAALADHGKLILQEIAAGMLRPEGDVERQTKSEGNSTTASTSPTVPSRVHARQRERQGFEIEQMLAEYRALRATVLRHWTASSPVAHAQDLADVTRFNEAVDQALAESTKIFVEEMNRTRDLFLGMLGHDLRGPLSAITMCAHIQQRTQSTGASQSAIMLRSVAQMKALLDDLVEYTRGRLGAGLAVDPTPLQLDQFVRQTLEEIGIVSVGRKLQLTVDGDLQGQWDASRLHQALSNLVFNALKYSYAGSDIQVHLDGRLVECVVISVENKGRPIDADLLPRLFDPLVRAEGEGWDAESQVAGANLGLGLYVVREIAIAHGGSVQVESRDATTRFELRLPRVSSRRAAGDRRPMR
jgi:signal transduction histidine kinase